MGFGMGKTCGSCWNNLVMMFNKNIRLEILQFEFGYVTENVINRGMNDLTK